MNTQPISRYVLKTEYDTKMKTIEQKFDEFTETMLGQFDQVYARFDRFEASVDQRLQAVDLRFNRLDHTMAIMTHSLDVIMKHLGISEDQMAI